VGEKKKTVGRLTFNVEQHGVGFGTYQRNCKGTNKVPLQADSPGRATVIDREDELNRGVACPRPGFEKKNRAGPGRAHNTGNKKKRGAKKSRPGG